MRVTRIVGALVALMLTLTMGPALLSPAHAAGKPKHDLTAVGLEIGNTDKFIVKGKVTTYPGKKIRVMRKVGTGRYVLYKKVKTSSTGKFRTRIFQVRNKRTCFKVVVPSTPVYKKTQDGIGCIVSV